MSALDELADPALPMERLQQLALEHPELGASIAAHPNCYPELKEWVEQHAQAVAALRTAAPVVEPAPRPRTLLKVLGLAAATLLPMITVASIAVPIITELGERQSSPESLQVEEAHEVDPAAPVAVIGELSNDRQGYNEFWRIPVSAELSEFPAPSPDEHGGFVCGEEQYRWLESQGEWFHPGLPDNTFTVTLRNSASTANALSLGNIRFEGEEIAEEPRYNFYCNRGGRGAGTLSQLLVLGDTGEAAVYSEPVNASGAEEMPAGAPVVLNLSPGEVIVVTLTRGGAFDPQRSFKGSILADVIDGDGETVVLVKDIVFHREPLQKFELQYGQFGMPDGVFYCGEPGNASTFASCSIAEATARARENANAH